MLDSTPAWVAVMTHPHKEALVAKRLRDAPQPIECYLPMLSGKDKRMRRQMLPEKPMFPNYLFARINDKQIYQTRTTTGVVCIVSAQHSIIRVPDREIEAVRLFEASQRKVLLHETSSLVRGRKVTILEGEFAGMEGTLVKDCKDGNFCVTIEVMNISLVTRVRRDELKPHSSGEPTMAENEKRDTD